MDSGASHHVINDPSVIEQGTKIPYKNHLLVGIGQSINVESVGKYAIVCNNQGSSLKLNELLHIPKISKNLIIVSQLASDNNILVEFDYFGYTMKDKLTGKVLIQGVQNEGLY